METYLFNGTVLPERAQLTLQFGLTFTHIGSGTPGTARVSIVLNQLAVWIETERVWDVHDLRNVVKTIVQNHLAILGYIKGYAYDLEITRVLNPAREVDYVFGIDIPCIAQRAKSIDLDATLKSLAEKMEGAEGVFLTRCFNDLSSAMKNADDTGFYCYRAIESLRHHCASRHGLAEAERSKQWEKFREVSKVDESTLRAIKETADPLRHGQVSNATGDDRVKLFTATWDVISAYLNSF